VRAAENLQRAAVREDPVVRAFEKTETTRTNSPSRSTYHG
jgi:hypothetical protein